MEVYLRGSSRHTPREGYPSRGGSRSRYRMGQKMMLQPWFTHARVLMRHRHMSSRLLRGPPKGLVRGVSSCPWLLRLRGLRLLAIVVWRCCCMWQEGIGKL